MVEKGIRRTEAGVFCEACGNDLSVDGSAELISCWDGLERYGYNFKCTKCGATLSQTGKISKEDAMKEAET